MPRKFIGAVTLLGLQASDNSWLESLQVSYGLLWEFRNCCGYALALECWYKQYWIFLPEAIMCFQWRYFPKDLIMPWDNLLIIFITSPFSSISFSFLFVCLFSCKWKTESVLHQIISGALLMLNFILRHSPIQQHISSPVVSNRSKNRNQCPFFALDIWFEPSHLPERR